MDPAGAILSTIGAKTAAWQTAQAEKAHSYGQGTAALATLAAQLGDVPTLLQKGKEEREQSDVDEAALGGYLHGGPNGMEAALSGITPTLTTPGGRARALTHVGQLHAMRLQGVALATANERLKLMQDTEAQNTRADAALARGMAPRADYENMAPVATDTTPVAPGTFGGPLTPPGPLASGGDLTVPTRAPTQEEFLGDFAQSNPGLANYEKAVLGASHLINARDREANNKALAAAKAAKLASDVEQKGLDRAQRESAADKRLQASLAAVRQRREASAATIGESQANRTSKETIEANKLKSREDFHNALIDLKTRAADTADRIAALREQTGPASVRARLLGAEGDDLTKQIDTTTMSVKAQRARGTPEDDPVLKGSVDHLATLTGLYDDVKAQAQGLAGEMAALQTQGAAKTKKATAPAAKMPSASDIDEELKKRGVLPK
jgi:hypothetical protein